MDEYDNTAIPSGNAVIAAPLLGRGWSNGITLSPGEVKTVTIAMYAKGTIVTVCGAPASGGSGTSGDNTVDGILAVEAYLGNPTAVKAGPDDAIYVSSSAFKKVKRIDRYGYLSNFAGNGAHGTITPGAPAASSPIGAVSDIDIDPAGNLYLFNDWNQIVRVDNGVVNKLMYDNGTYNSAARFNLAVVNVDLVYFVNYLDPRVYRVIGTSKSDYVTDTLPYDTTEPFDRFHYPLRAPSSITYASMSDSLIFADTDNDRIMRLSFSDLNIYYLVANAGGTRFSEGIDPLAMAPSRPRVVDYNPITGKIFFVEGASSRVLYIDAAGKVRSVRRDRGEYVLRRRRPRDGRRVERPAGDRGRLPRKRLHRRQRQPRNPHGRRRRLAVVRQFVGWGIGAESLRPVGSRIRSLPGHEPGSPCVLPALPAPA